MDAGSIELTVKNFAHRQVEFPAKNSQLDLFTSSDFFAGYLSVFDEFVGFARSAEKLAEKAAESAALIEKTESEHCEEKLTGIVRRKLKELEQMTGDKLSAEIGELYLIIFLGDGSYDGHGMLLGDESFVFFDLAAQLRAEESNSGGYDLEAWAAHELIHALHYGFSPEFYLANYEGPRDRILKRTYAEGLATWLSDRLLDASRSVSLWLGLLPEAEVKRWQQRCREERQRIAAELKKQFQRSELNLDLFFRLFARIGSNYIGCRCGYYYGFEVVENLKGEKNPGRLLELEADRAGEEVRSYFNL